MNKIRIQVVGGAAAGKSALAQFITEALLEKGFDADLIEIEHPPRTEERLNDALETIKQRSVIQVESVQARRGEVLF